LASQCAKSKREKVKTNNMQFGFMRGKGTTDAIFIARQLQEKYIAKKKGLWMAFVDPEKAFDHSSRGVLVSVEVPRRR